MANGRARAGAQHLRESDVRRMSGVKVNNLSGGGYAGRTAAGEKQKSPFRWRCARGKHPYPSRTRWLSPGRPMVLCGGLHGRAGGCRNLWKGL